MSKTILLGAFVIDHTAPETFQQQIYQRLREMIRSGKLQAGTRLPATRQLAADIGVSRNTVSYAYALLASEGYIETKQGVGTMIAQPTWTPTPETIAQHAPSAAEQPPIREASVASMLSLFTSRPISDERCSLRPFTPDVRQFPFKTWRRLMARRSMLTGSNDLFGYGRMIGFGRLRQVIADYVSVNRGTRCDPDQVIITNGAQAAINLIARALIDKDDTVWMEEPGYYWARFAFLSRGAKFAALPVGLDGVWRTDDPDEPVKLLYLTPSCQQPLGSYMPVETRQKLAELATRKKFWIVEDDFGNELKTGRACAPAIQGLDLQGNTIYIGSFSKSMFPALRIGFMLVPKSLTEIMERYIFATGHVASLPPQGALSDFIEEGYFSRHLTRVRKLYAARRETFLSLCDDQLSEWLTPIAGTPALQIPFLLRESMNDSIFQDARIQSLNLVRLSAQYFHGEANQGVIMGFAALNEAEMNSCISRLRNVLSSS